MAGDGPGIVLNVREVKLCLLGDVFVGKTSLTQAFAAGTFTEGSTQPTIGASFMAKSVVKGNNSFKYQIWDTAGQEKYRGLAPMYYRGAAAAILVYDITSEKSFERLQKWVDELKKMGPENIVIALAGNKSDLADRRAVETARARGYAEGIGAAFYETSAADMTNVVQLFEDIADRLPPLPDKTRSPGGGSIKIVESQEDRTKKRCC